MSKYMLIVFTLLYYFNSISNASNSSSGFASTSGNHFVMNGRPFYINGFNAYWMMYTASDPLTRNHVTTAFQQACTYGMNVVRTWAFSDGGYRPLQISPGSYNEEMFKGLDFVISEAKHHGVYLILSLVNNWEGYGGKKQYVEWANDQGQVLKNEDDFYTNDLTKQFYKNHVKAILTRVNSITGTAYKDDPTIFAWELINEPQCQTDPTGATLQKWILEMSAYVKSIDSNHMLEAGLEGFYGESNPARIQFNPGGYEFGSDFIANNQIPEIDFATIHIYPDQWIEGEDDEAQTTFLQSWITSHTQDAALEIRKPLLVTEFGRSSNKFSPEQRDAFFLAAYNKIYASARVGGPCTGGLFWQYLVEGMDGFRDGYEIVIQERPSTDRLIFKQSQRILSLNAKISM